MALKKQNAWQPGRWRALRLLLPLGVMMLSLVYLMIRTVLFIAADYGWMDKIVAFFVLFAEAFILLHGLGYMRQLWRVSRETGDYAGLRPDGAALRSAPSVAVVVASYREPLDILESTLSCIHTMTWPNKRVILLDDTRYDAAVSGAETEALTQYRRDVDALCKRMGAHLFRRAWRGAKAGIINDFMDYMHGDRRPEFVMTSFDKPFPDEPTKYLAVFDADQQPLPGFLEPLVAEMEARPRHAFIQTPQYYTNFEDNRVARAAGLQQVVFFEFICQGKGVDDAMFCCGTNVLFRCEAFRDAGGFREDSVTEDFATSLTFHRRGWHSSYSDRVGAFGMGPEDLAGYFKQQFRWALGTVGMLGEIVRQRFSRKDSVAGVRWMEYVLSSTFYLTGLMIVIMMLCPMLFLFFNVPSYFVNPEMYAIFFIPYFTLSLLTFYWSLARRGNRRRDVFQGQLLIFLSFPVYVRAAVQGLLGIRGTFQVTAKTGARTVPWRAVRVQLLFLYLNFAALVWGAHRLVFERVEPLAVAVNMLWCLYHFALLSSVFYFNRVKD